MRGRAIGNEVMRHPPHVEFAVNVSPPVGRPCLTQSSNPVLGGFGKLPFAVDGVPISSAQTHAHLLLHRATAATAMNELSSRSHAIFTIVIKATATTKLSRGNKDKGAGGDDGGEQETDVR